ncbi:MAG: methylated-DNA--[protein]-cysteine S-methyltransferase [Thermodesulfobacteriota bacterium]|nr:MAG: methylated-DNA--[protein]-cysteine S-methyltransferase [Thermodesulfobacteriota bacterium]
MDKLKRMDWAAFESPLGVILVASDASGLAHLCIRGSRIEFVASLRAEGAEPMEKPSSFAALFRTLDEYFKGKDVVFSIPLSLSGAEFDRAVWEELRRIPRGSVKTYGEVARSIGKPGAARAVGGACGRNPVPIVIPCHRVVAADLMLGGFSGGMEIKKALLEIEGLEIRGRTISL